jgi:hypothetical protein
MAKYLLAYHGGGMPETPEEGERIMAAWTKWMGELGLPSPMGATRSDRSA